MNLLRIQYGAKPVLSGAEMLPLSMYKSEKRKGNTQSLRTLDGLYEFAEAFFVTFRSFRHQIVRILKFKSSGINSYFT